MWEVGISLNSDSKILYLLQVRLLRDEMGLTTTSYEGQLSMMSEHVASMNDKLATQTDQVQFVYLKD